MMLQIHDAYIESANMLAESNPMADTTPNDVVDSRCVHRERQHAGGVEPDGRRRHLQPVINDVVDSRCVHRERQHAGGVEPDGRR